MTDFKNARRKHEIKNSCFIFSREKNKVPKILKRELYKTADSESYSESINAASISHTDENHALGSEFQVCKHSLALKE